MLLSGQWVMFAAEGTEREWAFEDHRDATSAALEQLGTEVALNPTGVSFSDSALLEDLLARAEAELAPIYAARVAARGAASTGRRRLLAHGPAPTAAMHAAVVASMQHVNNAIDVVVSQHVPGVNASDILAAVDVLGTVFNTHLPDQVRRGLFWCEEGWVSSRSKRAY